MKAKTKSDYNRQMERRAALLASKPPKKRRGANVLAAQPSCGKVTMGAPRAPTSRRPRAVEGTGVIIVGSALAPVSVWATLLGMQGGRRRDYRSRRDA